MKGSQVTATNTRDKGHNYNYASNNTYLVHTNASVLYFNNKFSTKLVKLQTVLLIKKIGINFSLL